MNCERNLGALLRSGGPPVLMRSATKLAELCWAGRFGQLLLLTVASGGAIYARSTVGPLQEAIRSALALSDNQIALLQGPAIALPLLLTAIPLGLAIDRYSRVRLIFILTLLNLVGSLMTAVAPTFLLLLAARCLIGMTGTATYLVTLSVLSDLFGSNQRGRATMVVTFGGVAGISAAFALGGELLGGSHFGDGWRWAMLWLSSPIVIVTFLVLSIREPARRGVRLEKPSGREAFAELRRYRAMLIPLVLGLAMVVVADGASIIWAAPTLSRRFSLPPARIGAIVSLVMLVSGVAGPVLGGVIADACQKAGGPRRTLSALIVLALVSAPAGLFAAAPSTGSVTVLLAMFMTIGASFNVAVPALLTVIIPTELRGLCLAVCSATAVLSTFGVAPLVVSLLSGTIGGPAMIGNALAIVCTVSSLIGAGIFTFGRRYFPRAVVRA